MALSSSPRKVVPLSGGDDWPAPSTSAPSTTKRVFLCGVVVENIGHGYEYSQDVQDLVASLGEPLASEDTPQLTTPEMSSDHDVNAAPQSRKRAMTDSSALSSVISELVNTERSYVHRLRLLKQEYADPLRTFARSKDTAIISPYDAKTLFGNVDSLLPVNEAFLADLERMLSPEGPDTVGGVGDVALRHFKDLRGFDQYKQYYVKREEAQSIFEREMTKKSSGFAAFVDRIKYSNADVKNRIGLRELLMDPVQRIPRYTLLFRTMVKHMAPGDPQRPLLMQADEFASKIALAEMDDQTKRAAVIHCLCATVDNFPPALISNSRRFIDCIDVEDLLADTPLHLNGGHPSNASSGTLHATLILFDDKLMILKRPGNGERSGRALAGLDELEKVTKTGGLPLGMKKNGLSCKGVMDILDVVATDVGSSSFHLYLEAPPHDDNDRWSGRPFRSFLVVYPPAPANMVPTKTESAKNRFLESLWDLQARYRTRLGQSVVLCADEQEVESKRGRVVVARTYYNVYQRTSFLKEAKKPKLVVHIDEFGAADPLPFGVGSAPYVVIRIQPMAGNLSRYTVTSSDPNDESEEDIVQTARIPARIVQTTHQYGLFKFRTDSSSAPATPSASTRSRASIFGLDAISRNLFNARPGSTKGDIFGGSTASRRPRSLVSRSNTTASTATSGDGSLAKFSQSSQSTAATSVYDDDDSVITSVKSRSLSRSRRLVKRSKSAGLSEEYGNDRSSSRLSQSTTSHYRATSEPEPESSDEDEGPKLPQDRRTRGAEGDLKQRLDLARQNSHQHVEETLGQFETDQLLYDDAPPEALRPPSRASRDTASHRSVTPTPRSTSPSGDRPLSPLPLRPSLSSSVSSDRRPGGPRSVSPLPLHTARLALPPLPVIDIASLTVSAKTADVESPVRATTPLEVRSPIPRSRRIALDTMSGVDATPKASSANSSMESKASGAIVPLLIRKKSVRADGSPVRETNGRESPLARPPVRPTATSRPPSQLRVTRTEPLRSGNDLGEAKERVVQLAQATKTDLGLAHSALKRLRAELEQLQDSADEESADARPSTPIGRSRIPTRPPAAVTKEAQQRMEEMRMLIARRGHTGRTRSMSDQAQSHMDQLKPALRNMNEQVSEIEDRIAQAIANHERCVADVQAILQDNENKLAQLNLATVEQRSARRECEALKELLDNTLAEKEVMYETVNEELDHLFNNVTLPQDEAWTALTQDLRKSKEAEHALANENSQLKRRLIELESQQEEWATLLRSHSLIP